MRIPYGEAWLLEAAVRFTLPVYQLTLPSEQLRAWLNRGTHNLSTPELQSTLRRLLDEGRVFTCEVDNTERMNPTDAELADAIAGRIIIGYGLTQQGGEFWESLAKPDWGRYFEDAGWNGDTVTLVAGSRERLVEIVQNAELLWQVRMHLGQLKIKELHPCEVTYWKTVPVGYEAVASYEGNERVAPLTEGERASYMQLRSWCTSICGFVYV